MSTGTKTYEFSTSIGLFKFDVPTQRGWAPLAEVKFARHHARKRDKNTLRCEVIVMPIGGRPMGFYSVVEEFDAKFNLVGRSPNKIGEQDVHKTLDDAFDSCERYAQQWGSDNAYDYEAPLEALTTRDFDVAGERARRILRRDSHDVPVMADGGCPSLCRPCQDLLHEAGVRFEEKTVARGYCHGCGDVWSPEKPFFGPIANWKAAAGS